MHAIKVPRKNAETVKKYLIEVNNLSSDYKIVRNCGFIYFPIISKTKVDKKYSVVSVASEKKIQKPKDLREKILQKLTKKELEHLKTSFDHIGTIAILEIDPELQKKEKLIGKALLEMLPSIKTVLKKDGRHEGEFRTQKMKLLAGIDTRETIHRENGISLLLDVEKVYFSPRLSNERKRIMQLVKPGESILVMFSGCAPYPCVLAKNTTAKEIYGVELNPIAHQYAVRNVAVNKLKNVSLYLGDVRVVVPKFGIVFDRILMPLPRSSQDFLDVALAVSKNRTVIHCYDFLHKYHFQDAVEKVENACAVAGKRCKILRIVKCGQHSPHIYRICVDFVVGY